MIQVKSNICTFMVIFFVLTSTGNGQITFSEHILSESADDPMSIFAKDMDGDLDIDLVIASAGSNKVEWYENLGNYEFTLHTLSSLVSDVSDAVAVDIDGDEDMDVVCASKGDYKIILLENPGTGIFGVRTIADYISGAYSISVSDLDNDGDLDIIPGSGDSPLIWLENAGDNKFNLKVIDNWANDPSYVVPVDFDHDNDIDIVTASRTDNRIIYYENDGEQTFTAHYINTSLEYPMCNTVVDIDNDRDYDIVVYSDRDGGIKWYENDGKMNFTERDIVASGVNIRHIIAADIDNDNDYDIIASQYIKGADDKLLYFENKLKQITKNNLTAVEFAEHVISSNIKGPNRVYAFDIEGDGDMDVFSTSAIDNKISLFENMTITSISSNHPKINTFRLYHNYPNPFNPVTTIKFSVPIRDKVKITIFNLLGQYQSDLVNKEYEPGEYEIEFNGENLTSGLYFYQLQVGNLTDVKKMILLK